MKVNTKKKEESFDNNKRQYVCGRLQAYERGWNVNNNNSNYGKGENLTKGQGKGNLRSRYNKSQVQCYNCQKFRYHTSECRAQVLELMRK